MHVYRRNISNSNKDQNLTSSNIEEENIIKPNRTATTFQITSIFNYFFRKNINNHLNV